MNTLLNPLIKIAPPLLSRLVEAPVLAFPYLNKQYTIFDVSFVFGVFINLIPCQPVTVSAAIKVIVSLCVPIDSSLPCTLNLK